MPFYFYFSLNTNIKLICLLFFGDLDVVDFLLVLGSFCYKITKIKNNNEKYWNSIHLFI